MMRGIFAVCLLFAGIAEGLNKWEVMFQVVERAEQLEDGDLKFQQGFFSYALPGYRCVQVISDQSVYADQVLTNLHTCPTFPPVVHGYWSEDDGCEGFIIISENISLLKEILTNYPLYYEHRFIIIIPQLNDDIAKAFDNHTADFGDAEVLVVSPRNFSNALKLGQPYRNNFQRIRDFTEPWEVEEFILDFQERKIKALTYNCSFLSQIGPLNNASKSGDNNYWKLPSFITLTYYKISTDWTYGAEIETFSTIATALNLTIEWQTLRDLPKDAIFFSANKWYMEPISQLKTSERVDAAFCGLTLSYKKPADQMDMSEPLIDLCFQFLVPRPKIIQSEWNSIFLVFDLNVWATIGLVLLITTLILQKVSTYSRQFVETKRIHRYNKLGGSCLQLLSILVLADVPNSSSSQGATRYILSFWSFTAMVITTCFSSGLVSHLTAQSYGAKYDTIEKLVANDFHWGYLTKPDYSELLDTAGNVMHARLKYRAVPMDDLKEHVDNLKKGRYFLWGVQILNWFFVPEDELPESVLQQFEIAGDCFIDYHLGFAFREGSPFVNAFGKFISTYKETGLMKRNFARILTDYSRKHPYSYTVLRKTGRVLSSESLKLQHLTGIIEVWAVGISVGILTFLLELLQKCHI